MFLGGRADPGGARACIVERQADTRMTFATVLPSKYGDLFVVDQVVTFMSEVGCLLEDVVVRSDQEASIKHNGVEVGKRRAPEGGGKLIVEYSLVGCCASTGVVERAMPSAQGQVWVMRLAPEKRLGVELLVWNPMVDWLVECALHLLNRCEVGHDGPSTGRNGLRAERWPNSRRHVGAACSWP